MIGKTLCWQRRRVLAVASFVLPLACVLFCNPSALGLPNRTDADGEIQTTGEASPGTDALPGKPLANRKQIGEVLGRPVYRDEIRERRSGSGNCFPGVCFLLDSISLLRYAFRAAHRLAGSSVNPFCTYRHFRTDALFAQVPRSRDFRKSSRFACGGRRAYNG